MSRIGGNTNNVHVVLQTSHVTALSLRMTSTENAIQDAGQALERPKHNLAYDHDNYIQSMSKAFTNDLRLKDRARDEHLC